MAAFSIDAYSRDGLEGMVSLYNAEYRRKGIGAALVGHAMRLAYDRGARFGSVGTQLWNAPAHATYAKLGYRPHCVVVGRTLEEDG